MRLQPFFTRFARATLVGLFSGLTVAVGTLALSSGAGALVSPSLYSNYPASATVSQTCAAANLKTISFTIGSWTGTDLMKAPTLTAGEVVTWVFKNNNAACTQDVATLALYASTTAGYNANLDQTSAGSASVTVPNVGSTATLTLTVPAAFAGPYQLDAVFGTLLPVTGPDGNYYGGQPRTTQSDGRDMLVSDGHGAIGPQTNFPDMVTQSFNYGAYPGDQYANPSNPCNQGSGIATYGAGLGFTVNGVFYGINTPFTLAAGDVVTYTFKTTSAACNGQKLCIALYRNPIGGVGLADTRVNQALVRSSCATGTLGGLSTLTLHIPEKFVGGYQLDIVVGDPLPIVGNAGYTYGAAGTLEDTNYGIMGA